MAVLVPRVIALSSLVYPYFQLDIKYDAMRKPYSMKQKNCINWTILFFFAICIVEGVY